MKLFMLAGENSGDALGGPLITSLKQQNSALTIEGIGGPKMIKAGMDSIFPMSELNIMGVVEVISQLPRLLKLINGVVEEVETRQPDIYLGVDFPDFNFQVAQRLKKRGIFKGKIYHYVAPTVWAWRPGRAKKISKFLDGLFCLFPFEPDYFKPHGLAAHYVGHHLIETDPNTIDGQAFRNHIGVSEETKICGLFFGSRPAEIANIGDQIVETAMFLHERIPDIQFIIPTLPEIEFEVTNKLQSLKAPRYFAMDSGNKYHAFKACDVAVAVSGTVGLELAYLGVPHVIGYRTNMLTYSLVKSLAKTKYIHLANILLDEPAIPEFIQFDCKGEAMADALEDLLTDRKQQNEGFSKLRTTLKADIATSPSEQAAQILLN